MKKRSTATSGAWQNQLQQPPRLNKLWHTFHTSSKGTWQAHTGPELRGSGNPVSLLHWLGGTEEEIKRKKMKMPGLRKPLQRDENCTTNQALKTQLTWVKSLRGQLALLAKVCDGRGKHSWPKTQILSRDGEVIPIAAVTVWCSQVAEAHSTFPEKWV